MQRKTQLLHADNARDLASACYLLQQGELVAVPTETVYGLAADANNPEAVHKIFVAKNRPTTHPLIVHIAAFEKLPVWVKTIPAFATTLAAHFWPGPLTLLFQKADGINSVVTGGLDTIALRVPSHPTFLALLRELDTGLAAPSANPHKKISPTTAMHVMEGLSGKIAAVIDAGACAIGVESTIVDVTGDVPVILRPGPITKAMLEAVLQQPVHAPHTHTTRTAGNMAVHYQPDTPTSLYTIADIHHRVTLPAHRDKSFAVMHYSPFTHEHPLVHCEGMPQDKSQYTQRLYDTLHQLDKRGVDEILIEALPEDDEWSDVRDRLLKASAIA